MEETDFPAMHQLDHVVDNLQTQFSLEASVLENRARKLKAQATKLANQRAFIREERRRVRQKAAMLQDEKQRYLLTQRPKWFPASSFPRSSMIRIKLNVGGQVFEVSQALANKDPNSLLAALASTDSPLASDESGIFYVDRDWWVFRHLLTFLRDGVLPRDKRMLQQLYEEADYWRLQSLQRAIEERHLRMYRRDVKIAENKDADKPRYSVEPMPEGWWNQPPDWWSAAKRDEPKKKEAKDDKDTDDDTAKKGKKVKTDWWTGHTYLGNDYTLSADEQAVSTKKGAKDELASTGTVWERVST